MASLKSGQHDTPPRKPGFTYKLLLGTLSLTLAASVTLLLIDHAVIELWPLAVLIFLWMALAVVVIAPACVVLICIPPIRQKVGIRIPIMNVAAGIFLAWLVRVSDAIETLMYV